jgi:hypothetical protein
MCAISSISQRHGTPFSRQAELLLGIIAAHSVISEGVEIKYPIPVGHDSITLLLK